MRASANRPWPAGSDRPGFAPVGGVPEHPLVAGRGREVLPGFGPLRADIAVPLDKRTGDSDFQIYISIGQAF